VAGLAAAPRFPAVHPLSPVGVLVLAPDRLRRLDEVLPGSEELVVRRDGRAAQAFGSEVDEVGEFGHI